MRPPGDPDIDAARPARTALVTGAAHGIGRAVALELAAQGADVVVHYGTSRAEADATADEIRRRGRRALTVHADLRDPDGADRLLATVRAEWGGLDAVVANAGSLVGRSPLAEMTLALWDEVMAVNATATFLTCRAAIPVLRDGGAIVTMSSLAAHSGGGAGAGAYAAAKAAIGGFTRALAKELAPRRIRVNAVAPGFIGGTRFHERFTADVARPGIVAGIPLGEGAPGDVAAVVAFLASPAARFVTGETVDITGGQWVR
jgi:3-oxoacyl-[acyl-carrier protein] reductase